MAPTGTGSKEVDDGESLTWQGLLKFVFYAFIVPFSPLFAGVFIAHLLPFGTFRDMPTTVLAVAVALLPILWLAIGDAVMQIVRGFLARRSVPPESWIGLFTGDLIGAVVTTSLMMAIFEKALASLVVSAVTIVGYHLLNPYVESRYERDRIFAKEYK